MTRAPLFFDAHPKFQNNFMPPQRADAADLDVRLVEGKPFSSLDWRQKRIAMEGEFKIEPEDCPPIRNISGYGYKFFSAGRSIILKNSALEKRVTTSEWSKFGFYTHSGDLCPMSDSTFLSSWLGNSSYIKIISGIRVYCKVGFGLMQMGIPNAQNDLHPVSAIEYGNSDGKFCIDGERYFRTDINLVCRPTRDETIIEPGAQLGIFFPVFPRSEMSIISMPVACS